MTQTCIICGGATGSREHIFPAALGGRRTNKGIYCSTHNEGYAPLAAILSTQLKGINALLGVTGDHSNEAHKIAATDSASGRLITISNGRSEFAHPELASESVAPEGVLRRMMFSSEKQLQAWLTEERSKGHKVELQERAAPQSFFLSESQLRFVLGGTEGLRAIGYVAQTFLAHSFPDLARAPEMDAFKKFTQGISNDPHVWWDFSPGGDLCSSFEFGHRVVVGIDPATALAYARISLFSTFHFATVLGPATASTGEAVIVDINPLALHPPDDIVVRREPWAFSAVVRPDALTESLSETVISGSAQRAFQILMQRVADRSLAMAADDIDNRLKGADRLSVLEREQLVKEVLASHAQRILNLMRHIVESARASDHLREFAPLLELLIAADPTARNGLSQTASAALGLAHHALAAQMAEDCAANRLDRKRVQQLIGGAPGALIVGRAIMEPVIAQFPDR